MQYRHLDHHDLAARAAAGNEGAFRELYERHVVWAVRTAFLITGDHGLAEDAVQEAFVQAYRHLAALREA